MSEGRIKQWTKRRQKNAVEGEGGLSEERWDGREKKLQIIVGWGRKGEDTGRVDHEDRAVFERVFISRCILYASIELKKNISQKIRGMGLADMQAFWFILVLVM